jgi:hypothetical protein
MWEVSKAAASSLDVGCAVNLSQRGVIQEKEGLGGEDAFITLKVQVNARGRHRLFRVRIMLSNLIWKSEAVLANARAATSTIPFPPFPFSLPKHVLASTITRVGALLQTPAPCFLPSALRHPPSPHLRPTHRGRNSLLRRSVCRAPQTFSSSRRAFVSSTTQEHPPDAYTGTASTSHTLWTTSVKLPRTQRHHELRAYRRRRKSNGLASFRPSPR